MRKTVVLCFVAFMVFFSSQSICAEKDIIIGYASGSDHVKFFFNVPVTKEMMDTIRKQEGVASSFSDPVDRYNVFVSIGKMFSSRDVVYNIIRALEAEVFIGRTVRNQMIK